MSNQEIKKGDLVNYTSKKGRAGIYLVAWIGHTRTGKDMAKLEIVDGPLAGKTFWVPQSAITMAVDNHTPVEPGEVTMRLAGVVTREDMQRIARGPGRVPDYEARERARLIRQGNWTRQDEIDYRGY